MENTVEDFMKMTIIYKISAIVMCCEEKEDEQVHVYVLVHAHMHDNNNNYKSLIGNLFSLLE